eukprot:6257703-Pyramimonas_sp.AAC.1
MHGKAAAKKTTTIAFSDPLLKKLQGCMMPHGEFYGPVDPKLAGLLRWSARSTSWDQTRSQ